MFQNKTKKAEHIAVSVCMCFRHLEIFLVVFRLKSRYSVVIYFKTRRRHKDNFETSMRRTYILSIFDHLRAL